ncbi:MAG: mannose-1-phosphate guanylyltransferase [Sphingomonadales bacterium]|nr:mannose-1-phosphate guanylyltransferase [Sphingomonadales bacterium]
MGRIHPVILCGGSGTRLWPRSRASMPKPFLPLVGHETLFEQALSRAADPMVFAPPMVVTGAAHLAHVEAQLGTGRDGLVVVEPAAKNTAAAIALAAHLLAADDVMLVCPSDHHIGDPAAFVAAARAAAALAGEGWLVAFGITATAPETGYGYIRRGEAIGDSGHRIAAFVEKPDLARAEQFLADGGYAWNGGIFAFRAGDYLRELASHRPALAEAVREAVAHGRREGTRFHPEAAAFARIEGESVDYAVMENTRSAAVVPASMAWSDIGNWQALHEARDRDAQGNVAIGRVELVDCRNVLVESDGPRVSAVGLSDVIIVVDGDEVLVTTAAGAQLVGKLSGAANQTAS